MRAPSCSGSTSRNASAEAAARAEKRGGRSGTGALATLGTTQSPCLSMSYAVPNAVASSGFQGSWPKRPSRIQAVHNSTKPSCFTARYGPDGESSDATSVRLRGSDSGIGCSCRDIQIRHLHRHFLVVVLQPPPARNRMRKLANVYTIRLRRVFWESARGGPLKCKKAA